jgi:phosphatidylserine/phosphatidylglycerophosphate/cardiolipin synthase-like enzyme
MLNLLQMPIKRKRKTTRKKSIKKANYAVSRAPNLNLMRENPASTHLRTVNNVTVSFNNHTERVKALIDEAAVVKGCLCWLTSKTLIDALARCKGVSLVISRGKMARAMKERYKALKTVSARGAVRVLGAEGKHNSLLHHKFAIGYNNSGKALWLCTGSFNWSKKASGNLENLMIFRDANVIKAFEDEFNLLWRKSKSYV